MSREVTQLLSLYASGSIAFVVTLLHYIASGIAGQLSDVYQNMGEDLPLVTKILTEDSLYYWMIPVMVMGGMVAHHLHWIDRRFALLIGALGTLGSMIVCIFGLYLPLFQMGSLVQP